MSAKPLTENQKKELAELLARDPETLTDIQKAKLDELKARQDAYDAESLDNDNTTDSDTPGESGNVVYVFANLQTGQSFRLPDGSTVTIKGMPVSRLKNVDGQNFAGGKYGVTPIPADQWAEVMKIYGKMKIFLNGLVFDAPTLERGKAIARERGGLRHGYEQVDPESNRVKSRPKTDED